MSKSDHPNLSSHSYIIHDESMKSYTYMNIGGKARLLCKIGNIKDLCKSLDWSRAQSLDIKILGGCSNVLIDDNGWDGVIILLRDNMNNDKLVDESMGRWIDLFAQKYITKLLADAPGLPIRAKRQTKRDNHRTNTN